MCVHACVHKGAGVCTQHVCGYNVLALLNSFARKGCVIFPLSEFEFQVLGILHSYRNRTGDSCLFLRGSGVLFA